MKYMIIIANLQHMFMYILFIIHEFVQVVLL